VPWGVFEEMQSCPRRRVSLGDERPTRWSTRSAPEVSFYAACLNGCKLAIKELLAGIDIHTPATQMGTSVAMFRGATVN